MGVGERCCAGLGGEGDEGELLEFEDLGGGQLGEGGLEFEVVGVGTVGEDSEEFDVLEIEK